MCKCIKKNVPKHATITISTGVCPPPDALYVIYIDKDNEAENLTCCVILMMTLICATS